MVIYVIVCSESLKFYIGQHKKEELGKYLWQKWWAAHNRNITTRSHLYKAMRKYPREMWSIWSLVSGIETKKELDEMEKHFIRVLKAQHPDVGYNICAGGEGFTGKFTPEHRAKLRAAIANRDPEVENLRRRRLSEIQKVSMVGNTNGRGNKGIPHPKDEEFRRRVREKLTGRQKPKAVVQRTADKNRGQKRSGLALQHVREGNAWRIGSHQSQETIAKRLDNVGYRNRRHKSMVGFQHSEQAVQNMKDAQRKRRANQTHCLRGHELTEKNCVATRWKQGHRVCRLCANARARERERNQRKQSAKAALGV